MANNNNLLFNAALDAFVSASVFQRNIVDPTAADSAALVAQGVQFATEVDAKIPNDALISGGGGVTLPPTTAAIANAQESKVSLLYGICQAVRAAQFQNPATPVPAINFSVVAAAIAALYTETVASQSLG
jgi:hypothetical protein